MREYTKKPENQSRTLESDPKASRQAPIDMILQRYKERDIQRYTDLHVASSHEKHLPHDDWHVIQQKQSWVQPTIKLQERNVNNNEELEKEADPMGEKSIGNAITLQKKGDYKSLGGTSQVIQCWPDWKSLLKMKNLYDTLPNLAAGALDAGFGIKDLITEIGNSRKLIPQGSRVTIPDCTKGKVDGATIVPGNNNCLNGGTYTIEVEDDTMVTSTNDFVSEGWKRKSLRMAGSALSTFAGSVSAVATAAHPVWNFFTGKQFSESVADKWDKVSSISSGFGYSLANIVPRLKNRFFTQIQAPDAGGIREGGIHEGENPEGGNHEGGIREGGNPEGGNPEELVPEELVPEGIRIVPNFL